MILEELDRLEPLGAELARQARARGVQLIWRAQVRSVHRVLVREGRADDTGVSRGSGHGIQVYTAEGATALASRDDFDPNAAVALFERAVGTARRGAALGLATSPAFDLPVVAGRAVPAGVDDFESVDLDAVTRRLAELESEVAGAVRGPSLKISFGADLDAWRVMRADGSDVVFAMPRCSLRLAATSPGGGSTHSVGAAVSGPSPRLPWDEPGVRVFLRRAVAAARLARDLPGAPAHPAGSFPLVIDYALAKGLAHEAFGHAAEADGFRSSILADGGRFDAGRRVGAEHVSVVDEPVEGDHAWQPFSANGLPRRRSVIVERGRLCHGLADPWSAGPGGVPVTGAARAASFRDAPLPRMSNIRIEVDAPLPAPGEFEDYGPAEVRDLLAGAGVLRRHPRIVFLSGYSGGQVNTATGDFVFNCKAIYVLSRDRIRFHRPAIFSGSMFGALDSVREAFGPLRLDAIGTCGKWGQSVPSSGGSHFFLVLDPHPGVRLGGRS